MVYYTARAYETQFVLHIIYIVATIETCTLHSELYALDTVNHMHRILHTYYPGLHVTLHFAICSEKIDPNVHYLNTTGTLVPTIILVLKGSEQMGELYCSLQERLVQTSTSGTLNLFFYFITLMGGRLF